MVKITPTSVAYISGTPVRSIGGVALASADGWAAKAILEKRFGIHAGRPANFADADAYAQEFEATFGYPPYQLVAFTAGDNETEWQDNWLNHLSATRTAEPNNIKKAIDAGHATGVSISLRPFVVTGEWARLDPAVQIAEWYLGLISEVTHPTAGTMSPDAWADNRIALYNRRIANNEDQHLVDFFIDTLVDNGFGERPVDIRLLHEMNFAKRGFVAVSPPGRRGLVEAAFIDLWRFEAERLRARARERLGYWPSNWRIVFNPGSQGGPLEGQLPFATWADYVETFYPGDSWVDAISLNIYPDPLELDRVGRLIRSLADMGERHRKSIQINEMGDKSADPAIATALHAAITEHSPTRWSAFQWFGGFFADLDPFGPDLTATRAELVARFGV